MLNWYNITRRQAKLYLGYLCLLGIFTKPFFLRTELLGNFSSYQTVFGMIAQRYLTSSFENIFRPEIFSIENGRPSLELIFFPLVSFIGAGLTAFFGGNLDLWGRFASVAASVGTGLLLYRVARLGATRLLALSAVFFYTISPYVIVYGRNFQNEALALFFLTLALFFLLRDLYKESRWLIAASGISFGLAVTLRLHFILFVPFFFYLSFKNVKHLPFRLLFWTAIMLLLPVIWHAQAWYLQNRLDYIHTTLFFQAEAGKTFPHPLLLQSKFYLRLIKDLTFWAAGPIGFIIAAIGILRGPKNSVWTWFFFLLSALLIPFLIPQKFVDQHFYLYPVVIPFSLLAAAGAEVLLISLRRKGIILIMLAALIASFLTAWNPAFKRNAQDLSIFPACRFIQANTKHNEIIIAAHGSSGDLLYYSNRLGWGFSINPHERESLNVYMTIPGLNHISEIDLKKRNQAFLDSVSWLEYLRSQGAKFFFTSNRLELDQNPALFQHLKSKYRSLSGDSDPFYAFRLENDV